MNKVAYTYCLVRYVHNPALGEQLNVGVVLYAPSEKFFAGRFDFHFERLSKTFADFNGNHYRDSVRNLETAFLAFADDLQQPHGLFGEEKPFQDVKQILKLVMPEQTLSLQFSEMFGGITDDAKQELDFVFERAVKSQYPRSRKERRSDKQVWTEYQRHLAGKRINPYLAEKRFIADDYQLKYEHAFKNDKWHLLQPVTFDYTSAQYLQERAVKILGDTELLKEQKDFSRIYFLLGRPSLEKHQSAYIKAKNLLNRISVKKEVIEETEADEFAAELADYMKKHGVIK